MSEVWQYAIPVSIAAASFFHYLLALKFDKETPLQMSLFGFAFVLMLDAVFSIHQIAGSPSAPSQVATRVAYFVTLVSMAWTFLYLIIRGFQETFNTAAKSGDKWRR